ncbi:2-hydroxyacid dehydrogenase [Puniceicoccus vermicola]|uniref:2-hydroxyacid dehydrogenase n=1 Tax=Puniceicoccus vermicola TaxID=388746 RepID=A0A7X1AV57_9BACT|nr:2-hydroxyacid dehydrogenase [Puniceicoccus vermicola]MBC2600596.1 2-hydroxyacid dehydrogenase [Puniceicoccus vermicola]
MKVTVFSTKRYDRRSLTEANHDKHEFTFIQDRLRPETVALATEADAVCPFVHDIVDEEVIRTLAENDCRLIALRCAGFNNVDLEAARKYGVTVTRVPAYSPYAVAEFAVGLILSLNRKIHRAYSRVREYDFSIDGLEGFDLHGKTVGIIGTGKIGVVFAGIMKGFGCKLLAYDPYPNEEMKALGAEYVSLDDLFAQSDIISLHCPLMKQTHHIIGAEALPKLKKGVMIINTSRGGLIDADAAIEGVKERIIGALGLDVYEEEEGIFFEDHSEGIMDDDRLLRLTSFPNVLITSHQAFFTRDALANIADVTIRNLDQFEEDGKCEFSL